MRKKIAAVSVLMVAILVLVSFSSVVGYQSTKNSFRDSPLFSIRANRANMIQGAIKSNYLRANFDSDIFIPKRDNRINLVKELIDKIIEMDDETYNDFFSIVKNKFQNEQITEIFKCIRENRKSNNLNMNIEGISESLATANCFTVNLKCKLNYVLGMLLVALIVVFVFIPLQIINEIFNLFKSFIV
jgi:hypothetical protein